jgi:hypothetical protein
LYWNNSYSQKVKSYDRTTRFSAGQGSMWGHLAFQGHSGPPLLQQMRPKKNKGGHRGPPSSARCCKACHKKKKGTHTALLKKLSSFVRLHHSNWFQCGCGFTLANTVDPASLFCSQLQPIQANFCSTLQSSTKL